MVTIAGLVYRPRQADSSKVKQNSRSGEIRKGGVYIVYFQGLYCRKFVPSGINSARVHVQIGKTSDIALPSKYTWEVTAGFNVTAFRDKIFKRTCYQTNRQNLGLLNLDKINNLGPVECSLNDL
ncbi:hypothetical protein AHF37_04956 [Paragonimus kellicotti]|nr:hypothetical protein AHF37_04956 [Paragonimus kellicotti]